jgi:hypothetical protein
MIDGFLFSVGSICAWKEALAPGRRRSDSVNCGEAREPLAESGKTLEQIATLDDIRALRPA